MISVIIPTYNTALLIERTIRSVLNQTLQDFEILIVDDCSTDNTLEVVGQIDDTRIRILRQTRNQGPSAARNRGLKEAKGEYCAFLDGDDYWEPDFLKETASFLEQHSDAIAVSVMQCHKIPGKKAKIKPVNTGISHPVVLDDFFAFWAEYDHMMTGSILMRRNHILKTGGFREDLRICEDLEFWALVATLGLMGFIPKVLFTSDGGIVTKKQGWLRKNQKRWASAVPIHEWEKRIIPGINDNMKKGYYFSRGRIARNMCYSMIMAKKTDLARKDIIRYGEFFPKNKFNFLLRKAAKYTVLWFPLCWMLRFREKIRSI